MLAPSAIKIAVISTIITVIAVGAVVGIVIAVTDSEKCIGNISPPSDLELVEENGNVTATWTASNSPKGCIVTYLIQVFEDGVSTINDTIEDPFYTFEATPCTGLEFVVTTLEDESQTSKSRSIQTKIGEIAGITITGFIVTWEPVGKCGYKVSVDEAKEIDVEDATYDLEGSSMDPTICVDHKIAITPYKDKIKGNTTTETFQLDIGDIEGFEFKIYTGSKIEFSFDQVPACDYYLYYESEANRILLDDRSCKAETNTCSVDPNIIENLELQTCMTYDLTLYASSRSTNGKEYRSNPRLATLVVEIPIPQIDFTVEYNVELHTSVATWKDLGAACYYNITYGSQDPLDTSAKYPEVTYPDRGYYEFDQDDLEYCASRDVTLQVFSYSGDEELAKTLYEKHRPEMIIQGLDVSVVPKAENGEAKVLYANWTDLNHGVCYYKVSLDEAEQVDTRNNYYKFDDTTPNYCQNYSVKVTPRSGLLAGDTIEEIYFQDPESDEVVMTNMVAHIESKFLVVVDWSTLEKFRRCDFTYTAACSLNDNNPPHTIQLSAPPYRATKCKIDSSTSKFTSIVTPYVNNKALAPLTTECKIIDFGTSTMRCT